MSILELHHKQAYSTSQTFNFARLLYTAIMEDKWSGHTFETRREECALIAVASRITWLISPQQLLRPLSFSPPLIYLYLRSLGLRTRIKSSGGQTTRLDNNGNFDYLVETIAGTRHPVLLSIVFAK